MIYRLLWLPMLLAMLALAGCHSTEALYVMGPDDLTSEINLKVWRASSSAPRKGVPGSLAVEDIEDQTMLLSKGTTWIPLLYTRYYTLSTCRGPQMAAESLLSSTGYIEPDVSWVRSHLRRTIGPLGLLRWKEAESRWERDGSSFYYGTVAGYLWGALWVNKSTVDRQPMYYERSIHGILWGGFGTYREGDRHEAWKGLRVLWLNVPLFRERGGAPLGNEEWPYGQPEPFHITQ